MKRHKIYLAWLRHRYQIIFWVGGFVMLTVLALNLILLHRVIEQNKRQEEILKGLSCILLITPTDRTKINVTECVEKNTTPSNNRFEFNSTKAEPINETVTPQVAFTQFEQPKKITIQTVQSETKNVQQTPVHSETEPIRSIEQRISPTTGKLEFRYIGTDLWAEANL